GAALNPLRFALVQLIGHVGLAALVLAGTGTSVVGDFGAPVLHLVGGALQADLLQAFSEPVVTPVDSLTDRLLTRGDTVLDDGQPGVEAVPDLAETVLEVVEYAHQPGPPSASIRARSSGEGPNFSSSHSSYSASETPICARTTSGPVPGRPRVSDVMM